MSSYVPPHKRLLLQRQSKHWQKTRKNIATYFRSFEMKLDKQ